MARRGVVVALAASVAIVGATVPAAAQTGVTAGPAVTTTPTDIDVAPVTPEREEQLVQGRYVVVLESEPVVAYEGDVAGLAATAPAEGEAVDSAAPEVQEYVDHLADERKEVLDAAGVDEDVVTVEYAFAVNGFAAELSEDEAKRLAKQEGVLSVRPEELRQPQTDNSGEFLDLDARGGPWSRGYTGEGVVVGVIDTGIWPEHASFADDGSYPEPTGVADDIPCEFGTTPGNPDDAAFECNNKLIGARDMRTQYNALVGPELYDSARDEDGHGTHTASTAVGNARVDAQIFGSSFGRVTGVAPRAQLVAYKACGNEGCFTADLADAIDQAVADGVDVINYSIGGGAGAISIDDLAFLFANDAGVFVATSAGNDGPGAGTVGSPAVYPWVTSVGASTQDRAFEGAVVLGDGSRFTGASVTAGVSSKRLVDAADVGNELCLVGGFTGDVTDAVVLCKRGENARVEKSQAVHEAGGAGMVLYDVSDEASLVTDNHWVPSVHVTLSDGLAIKAYVAATEEPTASIEGGRKVRAQGSVMADFSSRGPNVVAPDIIVPDVTAPGVNILAGHTPTPALGAPGQLFQSISGTSMSSPHVAGVYALLKQAHPEWSPAAAKSAIMTTARQDVTKEDGTTPADPFDMGAGHIDPGGRITKGSTFQPGLVYDAGFEDYLGFLCGADDSVFGDPAATCAALEEAGFPTDPSDLNLASIGIAELAGTQTLTRTVTSVADERVSYRAKVDAPDGYTVTVEPSTLRLGPGESATVAITVTTTAGAELGEWSFGSLTWESRHGNRWGKGPQHGNGRGHGYGRDRNGGYEVRSPIAVRGVALDTPGSVSGTGTEGTATIPLVFGYDGPYAAAPHGLAPAQVDPGTVAQDPDQTAFTADDGAGLVAHAFDLTGTAVARWRVVDPSEELDLDLFLAGPDGELVAASTNGGTDEEITLEVPADGTYTLYVHGWQVPGGSAPYDLTSWVVPLEATTLTVEQAPDAAAIGATGEVVVGWSGLEADAEYLGAVSHLREGDRLGLTLVEVTTGADGEAPEAPRS
ncbi:S8 family serine peptidase [Actinotalea sp. AC32]|nr:S8 family serine peptidase [Actinotalea sp. AC32]